jgi:hypothetical protein
MEDQQRWFLGSEERPDCEAFVRHDKTGTPYVEIGLGDPADWSDAWGSRDFSLNEVSQLRDFLNSVLASHEQRR